MLMSVDVLACITWRDKATMEGALHGPAASEVLMSEEAVVRPIQKCIEDHHQEQLSNISE